MANLGTDVEGERPCANCGKPIVATFIAHGESQEGLQKAMPALAALARAVLAQYGGDLCGDCAPPPPERRHTVPRNRG